MRVRDGTLLIEQGHLVALRLSSLAGEKPEPRTEQTDHRQTLLGEGMWKPLATGKRSKDTYAIQAREVVCTPDSVAANHNLRCGR